MGVQLHSLPMINYFLLFNVCVTLLTIPYEILGKRLVVNNETNKNIFSLFNVQKRKLKYRRENV